MLSETMRGAGSGDGIGARLAPPKPSGETETSVAALMARSAPSSISTVLWKASDAAERQVLLDSVQSSAGAKQSARPVAREHDSAAPAISLTPSSASSDQFLSMLDTVTYPKGQAEDLVVGYDQGSGKGGVSVGDIDAINDSLSFQSFSAPDTRVTSALSKAGVGFQTNANGSIYVPSAGGYAVHASTGMGVPVGQALAGSGGGRTQASGAAVASSGSTGSASSSPTAVAANDIVVTAQSRPSASGGSKSYDVNPFAAASVSSPQSNDGPAAPSDAPEIVVTGIRDKGPEPFPVTNRTTISRARLDSWWVEFNYQTSTLGPRSDDAAIRQSFTDAYARLTEGELEAKAVAIDVVTTAIIAPAGAALVAVAAPVIAGAVAVEGTVLYYTTAATIGGTGNMLVNEGTHRLTSDAPVTTGERLGSFTTGMIFGGQFVIKGLSPVANGVVIGGSGAFAGDRIQQEYDTGHYDYAQGGLKTLFGAAAGGAGGLIGDTAIPGVTSGRGSWASTYQGVSTRIANGNASTMSPSVAIRGGAANQTNQIWSNATAAGVSVLTAPRVDQPAPKP